VPKWLETDQDNLHMKFSALNVDFISLSPDPLDSRRPAHASVKEEYPSKKWLFICCLLVYSVKMVADRHIHAAYHNKHWRRTSGMSTSITSNDLEPQNMSFYCFWRFLLQKSELRRNGWR